MTPLKYDPDRKYTEKQLYESQKIRCLNISGSRVGKQIVNMTENLSERALIFLNMNALVMTEEFWMNSIFSIARFSGGCVIDGKHYVLNYATKDLIRSDFVKTYQKVGREKVIEMLKDGKSKEEIEEYAKSIAPTPKPAKVKKIEPPRLNFDEE